MIWEKYFLTSIRSGSTSFETSAWHFAKDSSDLTERWIVNDTLHSFCSQRKCFLALYTTEESSKLLSLYLNDFFVMKKVLESIQN